MLFRRSLLSLAAAAVLTTGCRYFRPIDPATGSAHPADPVAPAAPASSPARTQANAAVTDANIAAMVMALNNTDISYARLAPARAERDDIKRFAERMLADHIGVNGLVNNLLTRLDIAAVDNVASLDMRDESAEKRDLLRELSGYKFDSTYIANEVTYHRKFLASIDNVMLPAAQHIEVRGLLNTVRPAVAAHLAHAEQVLANVIARQ
ncbi:MAG: DUF4142 domain-containing protein [Gemmatimonadaceae bacterium]